VREERRRRARGGEEVLLPLYRVKGEGRRGGGVGARRPAINGGGGRLGAAPVTGRGRAEAARVGGGGAFMA
jgi:hypothetical protein